jgi:hypothetical protein
MAALRDIPLRQADSVSNCLSEGPRQSLPKLEVTVMVFGVGCVLEIWEASKGKKGTSLPTNPLAGRIRH